MTTPRDRPGFAMTADDLAHAQTLLGDDSIERLNPPTPEQPETDATEKG